MSLNVNALTYNVHWNICDSLGHREDSLVWLDTDYSTAYEELKQKFKETKNPHKHFLVAAYYVNNGILTVVSYENNKLYEYSIYYNLDENKFEFVKGVEWKWDDRIKFFAKGVCMFGKRKMIYDERTSGYKCTSVEDIINHLKVNIFYNVKPTVEFK